MNRPGWEHYETTVYEDDLIRRGPPPPYRSIVVGYKRPRRKPGESPLDPPGDE